MVTGGGNSVFVNQKNKSFDLKQMSMQKLTPYFFIAPVFFGLLLLVVYPLIIGIGISFFNTNLANKWDFIGVQNYIKAFTEGNFLNNILITLKFTFLVVIGHFIIGTILGVALNKGIKGTTFFRTLLVLPWLFPDVVIALIFKWIANPLYGLLNNFLLHTGIISEQISWLGSKKFAFISIVFVCIWKGFPLVLVNVLAALQSVPADLYEAAKVDGANKLQTMFRIILPTIKPVLAVTVILDTVWWFKHFTIIQLMTSGGPDSSTSIVSIEIFKQSFQYFDFGKASAMSIVVFILCWLISKIFRRLMDDE